MNAKTAVFLVTFLGFFALSMQAEDFKFAPSAKFSAEEVVRIQLAALKNNDYPEKNAGIAVVYRFASPSNKLITGPLERFTAMIVSSDYRHLLDHRAAKVGQPDQDERNARVPIIVTTPDGQEVAYVFILSKQDDENCECWMTDSVLPIQPRETQRTPII